MKIVAGNFHAWYLIVCCGSLFFALLAGCFLFVCSCLFSLLLHNRLHVAHAVVNYYFLHLRSKIAVRSLGFTGSALDK